MSDKLKKGIYITLGVLAVIVVGGIIYSRTKKPTEATPQGFNELVERVSGKHPAIYAWWDSLTINQQIQIENSITPEIMEMVSRELSKNKPSEEVMILLRRLGYKG